MLNFTPQIGPIRDRINALRSSLTDTADQQLATQQLPEDGSRGHGINEWYLRLYYSVEDGMDTLTVPPRYRLGFLDRINSPDRLRATLVDFPTGIRFDGSYSNHLNWDVVKLFRYAWNCMDTATQVAAGKELGKMLDWCLKESYQPDGSFKTSELDETVGDAYFYGVSFLRDAGYFDSARRFWTTRDFPEAETMRERIAGKIKSIGLNDPQLRDAYRQLTAHADH